MSDTNMDIFSEQLKLKLLHEYNLRKAYSDAFYNNNQKSNNSKDKITDSEVRHSDINNDNSYDIPEANRHADVVWLCALPEERSMALKALNITEGNSFRQCMLPDYNLDYMICHVDDLHIAFIVQSEMGMPEAAAITTRAILALNPEIVVMSGICAGRSDKVELGDVIVPNQLFDYNAGKITNEGREPRFDNISMHSMLRSMIANEVSDEKINKYLKQFKNYFNIKRDISISYKTMGCGASVIDDNKTITDAAEHQGNLVGIDMESYGVALAANELNKVWVIAKGVQDFADGNKKKTENGVRKFASIASAIVVKEILDIYYRRVILQHRRIKEKYTDNSRGYF